MTFLCLVRRPEKSGERLRGSVWDKVLIYNKANIRVWNNWTEKITTLTLDVIDIAIRWRWIERNLEDKCYPASGLVEVLQSERWGDVTGSPTAPYHVPPKTSAEASAGENDKAAFSLPALSTGIHGHSLRIGGVALLL